VTKPELGTKRLCAGCNAKFYDLHKTPIVCPACQAVFELPKPAPVRGRRAVEAAVAPLPVVAAPKLKSEEVSDKGDDAEGDGADDAEGEKETDAGVPLLEIDEE
jgi:uncharacterized protein (TIGR02300 family)